MEIHLVSETSDIINTLTRPFARENCIEGVILGFGYVISGASFVQTGNLIKELEYRTGRHVVSIVSTLTCIILFKKLK